MTRRSILATGLAAAWPFRSAAAASMLGWSAARIGADGRARVAVGGAAQADGDAVAPSTLFQAASCSKTANALLVLRLAAEGALDLDAPLNAQSGCWRLRGPYAHEVTPARLLTHTAGTTVNGFPGYPAGAALPGLAAILDGASPANTPPVQCIRRPGLARYSGGGTMAVQALAEEAGGASWGALLRAHVLDPLGIDAATVAPEPEGVPLAHGHAADGLPLPGGWMRHPEAAAAGLWITAEGLARLGHGLLASLMARSNAPLPEPFAARMIRPVSRGAAMGLFVHRDRMWHDGANRGYRCLLLLDRSLGEATAVMTNADGGEAWFESAIDLLG